MFPSRVLVPAIRPISVTSKCRRSRPRRVRTRRPSPMQCATFAMRLVRVLDDDGQGGRAVGSEARARHAARDAARHGAGPRLRRPHVPRPAAGQDQLLHEVHRARRRSRSPPPHALDRDDMCFPTYRQQGLLIARGYPLVEMMCQIYSNKRRPAEGPPAADHVFGRRRHGFFSISGNLGTQYPQAVGWAMASGDQGRQPHRRDAGSATARPPRATSTLR